MFRLPDPITEQRLYEAQRDLSPLNRESLKTDGLHDSSNAKEIFSKEVLNNTNFYKKHKVKIQNWTMMEDGRIRFYHVNLE